MELNKWTFNWYGADKMINKDVLVEVKVSSISYCPVYHMDVLILKGVTNEFWTPLFLIEEDAGFLHSLIQKNKVSPFTGVKNMLQGLHSSIISVVLHNSPKHPFYAKIDMASGRYNRKEMDIQYVEAIALAIQVGSPILIDQDIIKQTSSFFNAESKKNRKAQKVFLNKLKTPMGKRETLEEQLQDAIQREDYELAANIRDKLKILYETNLENKK